MIIVVSLILAISGAWYAKRLCGCWFNPLGIFWSLWAALLGIYSLEVLPFYEIELRTFLILMAACICFCVGCAASSLLFLRRTRRSLNDPLEQQIDLVKLRRVTIGLYLVGVFLLIGYISEVQNQFSLTQILQEPWHLRAALPQGEFGWYLRFFYFTMPAAVLAFIHLKFSKTHRFTMHGVIWTSLAFGVATTGRTAVIWLMFWLAYTYLFLAEREGKGLKGLMMVALTVAAGFSVFLVFGNWLGKNYQSSPFTTTKTVDENLEFAVVPYYYLTSSIPAFQNLILEPSEGTWGTYTFLPLIKLIGPAFGYEAPSEVSEFTRTPYPANTYTFLFPYYQDFGMAGLFLGPMLLGFVVGYPFFRMRFRGISLSLLMINSLLTTVITSSYGTNTLISAPTWWFLAMAPAVGALCSHRRGTYPSRAPGRVQSDRFSQHIGEVA